MELHAIRCHPSFLPDGTAANCAGSPATGGFVLNGQPAVPGAPYANPGIDIDGKPVDRDPPLQGGGHPARRGPQQEGLALSAAAHPRALGTTWRTCSTATTPPAEPLFFRANSTELIEFWHTNLVPNYYELDDFQVRTPTDILGQHIHLVKFDVTSSDGAGNGFNYEDGTLSAARGVSSRSTPSTRAAAELAERRPAASGRSTRRRSGSSPKRRSPSSR